MFGEFGTNDYSYILQGGMSLHQVLAYVPEVIKTISLAIEVHYEQYYTYISYSSVITFW